MIKHKTLPKGFRNGFSMITAIFVIVLMASVAALIFNISEKTVRETTAQYQREQAVLLARSYTELAIMAVSARDIKTTSCLQDISGNIGTTSEINSGAGYKIQTNLYYIGEGYGIGGNCPATRTLYNNGNAPQDKNSTLNIIVDTYVKYRDMDQVSLYMHTHSGAIPGATALPWITYHRRTLQKI